MLKTYVANNKKCFVIHKDLIMWYKFSNEAVAFKQFNSWNVSFIWRNQRNMKMKMKAIGEFAVECRWIVVSRCKSDVEKHECNLSHAHRPTTLIGGVQKIISMNLAKTGRT